MWIIWPKNSICNSYPIDINVLLERIESTFRLVKLAQDLTKWSVICLNDFYGAAIKIMIFIDSME